MPTKVVITERHGHGGGGQLFELGGGLCKGLINPFPIRAHRNHAIQRPVRSNQGADLFDKCR
ncbi:Uncharacterised protein [Vibrio cholerae]|nr:Uncharacterised protein [Vibrio cholerae]